MIEDNRQFPRKVMVVSMPPSRYDLFYQLWHSKKMKAMAANDNKSVGDYSGMKSSIEDKAETISDSYMH